MKSFKQKQEEKQKHLDAERLILDEKAFLLQQQQASDDIESARLDEIAYNKALLEEQQQQENAIWEERESRKLESEYDLDYQESAERTKQIDDYRKLKNLELEYKSAQKGTIKDILSSEDQVRGSISSAERQIEMNEYEDHQLQKIEEAEILLEEELAEERAKQKQKNLKENTEQKKLARWKENEKVEQEEKQRMKELRESQEKETRAKKVAELQEIISSRNIYELRQKEIAKEQKEAREAVNKILQETQHILDSEKASREKDILSNLNDYIYRLNPNQERNIWTERKQPKSILTWEDWKQVPANNILIEQDFKRARLLFEQDNQRAQRYHDHVYQNFAARNLTLDRKKAIAADGKLVDIPYNKLVSTRKDIMEDIGGIQYWLDASDRDAVHTVVTASIGDTLQVSAFWVPDDQINVNDSQLFDSETYYSSSLVVENVSNLFDGQPDTFMTVRHTSASYDWNQRNIDAGGLHLNTGFLSGVFYLRVRVPENLYDTAVIDRLELFSTERKFIPEYVTTYKRRDVNDRWERLANFNITGSFNSSYNSQLSAGSEHTSSRLGGMDGITAEGSASMDPFYGFALLPNSSRQTSAQDPDGLVYDPGYYQNDYVYRICVAATGSECRFHGINVWYQEPDASITGSAVHGQGVHRWHSQSGPSINSAAKVWERTADSSAAAGSSRGSDNPLYLAREMHSGVELN